MKLGFENKKQVGALTVLGLVAAYLAYTQLFSGPSSTPAPAPRTGDSTEVPAATVAATPEKSGPDISRAPQQTAGRPGTASKNGEFHPVLRAKKKEDRIADIGKIDPTLRFDLIEKVMKVPPAGGERDLFQISLTPPVKVTELAKGNEPKIKPTFVGPIAPPPPAPPRGPEPPPPPMPLALKYYGYTNERPDGKRTAYFLDGEEIVEGIEGATVKGHYRIVQIGLERVVVEDTIDKRRQFLNLEPEAAG